MFENVRITWYFLTIWIEFPLEEREKGIYMYENCSSFIPSSDIFYYYMQTYTLQFTKGFNVKVKRHNMKAFEEVVIVILNA